MTEVSLLLIHSQTKKLTYIAKKLRDQNKQKV